MSAVRVAGRHRIAVHGALASALTAWASETPPKSPPAAHNFHYQPGSNNPTRLGPRLRPTQAFRSRLTRAAKPHSRAAAEALLLVVPSYDAQDNSHAYQPMSDGGLEQ